MNKTDQTGRILGIIVFLAGIAVLAIVFVVAYHFFKSPLAGIEIPSKPTATGTPTAQLGASALRMLARILSLIVMAVAGSLIASKGIHLYFKSSDREHEK